MTTPFPTPPTFPARSMDQDTFNIAMNNFFAFLGDMYDWANAVGTPGLGGGDMTGDLGIAAEVSVPAATTTDIGAAASNRVLINGSTTINSLGTAANRFKIVRFNDRCLLTQSAAIILPSGANFTTASGDLGLFVSDASGNWRMAGYRRFWNGLNVPPGSVLTIASGSITPTAGHHFVDTEGGAASDDLDTIATTNTTPGDHLILQANSSSRDVTVKNGTGNIVCGSDQVLDNTNDVITLRRVGSNWIMVSFANNGA